MKHLSPAEIETIRVPEPKHDPFSLESLVAWLERHPKDQTYCYSDNGRCLLAQYFTEKLRCEVRIGGDYWRFAETWVLNPLPSPFMDVAEVYPWTFGAALTRARAVLASQKGNANG